MVNADNNEVASEETLDETTTNLDELENTVNALVDQVAGNGDNATEGVPGFDPEKALSDMGARVDALESENKRLTAMLGKMVTAYGARMDGSDNPAGVEAFPSSVEKKFEQPTNEIPALQDIVLGV